MDVSIIGTLVDAKGLEARPFDVSFTLSGGRLITIPHCGWQQLFASVTNFSAEINGAPVAAPTSFQANVANQPSFYCANPAIYGELVSDPMLLESHGVLFSQGSVLFGGDINGWQIDQAFFTVSTPEPGTLVLLAAGLAFLGRFRKRAAR